MKSIGGMAWLEPGLRLSFHTSTGPCSEEHRTFSVCYIIGAEKCSVLASTPSGVLQERTWLEPLVVPPIVVWSLNSYTYIINQ